MSDGFSASFSLHVRGVTANAEIKLTHIVVITGRTSMSTSGLGKFLLQRRVLLQEAGRQQKIRSNRGMRYLGSTSSILIGPEEQAGDSQIER